MKTLSLREVKRPMSQLERRQFSNSKSWAPCSVFLGNLWGWSCISMQVGHWTRKGIQRSPFFEISLWSSQKLPYYFQIEYLCKTVFPQKSLFKPHTSIKWLLYALRLLICVNSDIWEVGDASEVTVRHYVSHSWMKVSYRSLVAFLKCTVSYLWQQQSMPDRRALAEHSWIPSPMLKTDEDTVEKVLPKYLRIIKRKKSCNMEKLNWVIFTVTVSLKNTIPF